MRFQFFHQFLLVTFFFILSILVGVQWQLIVALLCISIKTDNVDQLFVCLLNIL